MGDSLQWRSKMESLQLDASGSAGRNLRSLEDVALSSLWAWRQLPAVVFQWAWTSRGLVSKERMAELSGTGCDIDAEVSKVYTRSVSRSVSQSVSESVLALVLGGFGLVLGWSLNHSNTCYLVLAWFGMVT